MLNKWVTVWLLAPAVLCHVCWSQLTRLFADNIPDYELHALQDLYNSTGGEQWTYGGIPGVHWAFSADANPCTDNWAGVTCTPAQTDGYLHVQVLYLEYCGLVGTIPESIGNLTYMSSLSLPDNHLFGNIPTSIGKLTNLAFILFADNQLGPHIPNELFTIPSLKSLYISQNQYTGPIPQQLCNMTTLTDLELSGNQFTGTIPDCFCELMNLQTLSLAYNPLHGTIPEQFGNMHDLYYLDLSELWDLSGTVPPSFSALIKLQILDVSNNHLTGSLPAFVSQLPVVTELDFSTNAFTGSISHSVCGMPNLQLFLAFENHLNGTIPVCLTALPQMMSIELDLNMLSGPLQFACENYTQLLEVDLTGNRLNGTLPMSIADCSLMQYVGFGSNQFEGPISTAFMNLSILIDLNLRFNQLTGTIPNYFSDLPILQIISLNDNMLTSSIPECLLDMVNLLALDVGDNALTGPLPVVDNIQYSAIISLAFGNNLLSGTVPSEYAGFTQLQYLNLSGNHLHGSITAVANISTLNFLYVSNNRFTGPLPQNWDDTQLLGYFYADGNHFTGTVPSSLSKLRQLSNMNLSSNHFSGSLPAALSHVSKLQTLLLSNNALTGTLDRVFNASIQRNLSTVQFSNNQLTGTLPVELFRIPSLTVFAAVSNCFEGSIPASICDCVSLNTLALDGLQSATSCQDRLLSGSLDSITSKSLYLISSPLTGGIPACLFQMPNLTTLHLSGNGLSGSLPSDLPISASLTDLSLSHNKLQGSIPSSLLGRKWLNLDLSYNKITHSLSVNESQYFTADTSLSLQQNRLSGDIPAALQGVQTISILESNLFHCNLQRSDLPTHDEVRGKYQCGSDTFNATVYSWLAILSALLTAAAGFLWRHRSQCNEYWRVMRRWWFAGHFVLNGSAGTPTRTAALLPYYMQMCTLVDVILEMSVVCSVYAVVVLLPMYVATTYTHGSYAHQYAWSASAIYTSGHTAFALQFVFLVILVMLAVATFALLTRKRFGSVKMELVSDEGTLKRHVTWREAARSSLFYGAYILLNFAVVMGVNIAYVIISLNENGSVLTLAQTLLAVFKVAYNGVCTPVMIRWLSRHVLHNAADGTKHLLFVQLVVSLVNNILIPCLVVAIISPSCFYNAFEAPQAVTSSFSYLGTCLQYDRKENQFVACLHQEILTATTTYNPPFAYSYQCSSSFVTYYAPAYVIMCIIAGFVTPVLQAIGLWLHGRAVAGTRWFLLLDALLPRILKQPTHNSNGDAVRSDPTYSPSASLNSNINRPFVDTNKHITTLLTYLGLVLTFGAVFPPLAVCFTVTLGSIAAFTRLKVGRFLERAREAGVSQSASLIEAECVGAGDLSLLRRAVGLMVVFGCLFYMLFLFDTLGDATGLRGAYWVLIVMPLLPVLVFVVFKASSRWRQARSVSTHRTTKETGQGDAVEKDQAVELEMQPTAVNADRNPLHTNV